jgi:hypothetical protein
LLIGIRRVKGPYLNENIAKVIISMLKAMVSSNRIGYFIKDNNSRNDIVIRALLAYLRPNIKDPDFRRIKCFRHIINLAVKAFLFKKDADAFEEDF